MQASVQGLGGSSTLHPARQVKCHHDPRELACARTHKNTHTHTHTPLWFGALLAMGALHNFELQVACCSGEVLVTLAVKFLEASSSCLVSYGSPSLVSDHCPSGGGGWGGKGGYWRLCWRACWPQCSMVRLCFRSRANVLLCSGQVWTQREARSALLSRPCPACNCEHRLLASWCPEATCMSCEEETMSFWKGLGLDKWLTIRKQTHMLPTKKQWWKM